MLPTLTLALAAIAGFSRYQRNAMLDVLSEDFIRTARAKGLTRRRALFKHGLRTALIPMATLFAYGVSGLVVGAVFVEKIFGWHGMGEWVVQGISTQDTNVVAAITVFSGRRFCWPGCCPTSSTRRWIQGCGCHDVSAIQSAAIGPAEMTQEATAETTPVRSGIHPATFTSRRNLVARRFIRNKPAVVALILLVLLFVGCYVGPVLLPYSYTTLDYDALLQPPSPRHWFGTNALGQDLLARTLRGMQKSMLIGFAWQ
ncbi:binding--dependent transport system inner membrane component family protein [Mycobacterium xenopi 3993]|nr:binding--dependent transport system inner membrane component family protein [Mycobacterium xenopi 3993]